MAQGNIETRLDALLDRLRTAIQAVDQAEGIAPEAPNRRIYPPASPADVAAAERRLGVSLPPSYRAFLMRHNGWKGFDAGDLCIFGVSGPGYAEPKAELDRYLKSLATMFERQGPDYTRQLRERQKSERTVVYLPDQLVFGLNFNGDFWICDRNSPKKTGEAEAALVERGEAVSFRWPSFLEFVDYTVQQVESQVPAQSKKGGRATRPSGAPVKSAPSRAKPRRAEQRARRTSAPKRTQRRTRGR
jgi:hypothetical protein